MSPQDYRESGVVHERNRSRCEVHLINEAFDRLSTEVLRLVAELSFNITTTVGTPTSSLQYDAQHN